MKNQITVSILGTLPPIRALSSYCFELTQALARICQVEFISFKKIYPAFLYPGGKPDDDDTYPEIRESNIRIRRRVAWYNPFSWLTEGLAATGDLLHAQWWSMPLFPVYLTVCACFKLRKKPVIFTVHNVLSHEKSRIYFKLSQFLFRLGDHFIVHSHLNKQQMMDCYKINEHQISIIPHGSLDLHIRFKADISRLRKKFGLSPENRVILLFGAIRPYKGIDTAIRAFAETIKTIPDVRLLIAGRLWEDWNPYEQLIQDMNIEKQVIRHLDYIPSGDVHQFFEVADLCLFPYLHFDSQSGAGAAALSFRKPMIVSDVGGLPELVKDHRFIVPAGDWAALAGAMSFCLNDREILSGMASDAEAVSEQFAWPEIAKQTLTIYQQALK
ncbi:MAG: glycosyltransferase family 4 protein [Desulfobacteraceae bacterium]|nr:glycosyltransferase family 4 protein [Desulfobacteraceae bacterium]